MAKGPVTIVTHGGTDSRPEARNDGCEAAARAGLAVLDDPAASITDAVVAAVRHFESDGRFDAGIGSYVGMDGRTIEMDAAVMDSRGTLGAVAGIQHVRHPVEVARRVADTPHVLLVGTGAIEFARRIGLYAPFGPSEQALKHFRDYVAAMRPLDPDDPRHDGARDTEGEPGRALVRRFWNYETPWQDAVDRAGHGTVGAVARDGDGGFAVAVSTGGSPPSLLGRVADVPLVGIGFLAGRHGAIACSGIGEHNVRNLLASTIYRWVEQGQPLREAMERGRDLIPVGLQIGMIGITRTEAEVVSREPMACARLTRER